MYTLARRALKSTDVQVVREESLYQGFLTINAYHLQFRRFDHTWSPIVRREMVERVPAVGVLPYDPILQKVILIEQFRLGALQDPVSPWLLEVIAGLVDVSYENEIQTAHREMQEEAGLAVQELVPICRYWSSPGASNEQFSLYYARVDSTNAGGLFGVPEEAEDIRVHVIDKALAFEWLDAGHLNNAPSIIALQWLKLHHHAIDAGMFSSTITL